MTKNQLIHSISQLAAVKVTIRGLDIDPEIKARDLAALDEVIADFNARLAKSDGADAPMASDVEDEDFSPIQVDDNFTSLMNLQSLAMHWALTVEFEKRAASADDSQVMYHVTGRDHGEFASRWTIES